ncbi:MAG: putative metal-dependent hydrolase [Saprospiraceae bacterium]|nr:putative metal-dependent hydrolase [Saprospiraceae bacterium]
MEKLKYPVGRWIVPEKPGMDLISEWIAEIESTPATLQKLVQNLSADQWSATYRPESWTVLQLVHHLADSHINAYVRQKLAITGPTPIIIPYREEIWAELPDVSLDTVQDSIAILKSLHHRWVIFLKSLTEQQIRNKGYYHHGEGRMIMMEEAIGLYDWHCRHHLAHIRIALGLI